jgi:hypothetical protein
MRSLSRLALALSSLLLVGACSGPSQTSDQGPSAEPETTAPDQAATVSVADYETFEVATYPVRPPEQTVEVAHAVPKQLMKGRADEGVKQTVEGFRIQVFSAQDQEAAQDFRERVRQWWAAVEPDAPTDVFRSKPPIVIEYSQPYYRVRIGAFAEREVAADALEFVRKKYSGAFVARSTVTVVR